VLESVSIVNKTNFVTIVSRDVRQVWSCDDIDGKVLVSQFTVPDVESISGLTSRNEDTSFFFSFSSFLYPVIIFSVDLLDQDLQNQATAFRQMVLSGFDASFFQTKQVFFTSKAGTKVPMFIVHRKDLVLDGTNPTWLYGYGGQHSVDRSVCICMCDDASCEALLLLIFSFSCRVWSCAFRFQHLSPSFVFGRACGVHATLGRHLRVSEYSRWRRVWRGMVQGGRAHEEATCEETRRPHTRNYACTLHAPSSSSRDDTTATAFNCGVYAEHIKFTSDSERQMITALLRRTDALSMLIDRCSDSRVAWSSRVLDHFLVFSLLLSQVFADFSCAAEYLIAEKYTSPAKLAINGGSNGGLLVCACLNQRPELFGCVVGQVSVLDMLRFHKWTIGYAWSSDYGSSDQSKEMFEYLLRYSPVHNVRIDVPYPALLLCTSDHDDLCFKSLKCKRRCRNMPSRLRRC
jgi:hypothetical protein